MTMIDLSRAGAAATNLRGYLAEPAGTGPFPAVLMIHEAFGLNDIARRQADRLAAAGYLTLAVDLFSDGGSRRCLVSTMRSLLSGTGKAFADLANAQAWLAESGRTNGKIGVIGFCMGGGFALLIARNGFDAAAVNYGRLPGTPRMPSGAHARWWATTERRTAPCPAPRRNSKPRWKHSGLSTTSRNSRAPATRL